MSQARADAWPPKPPVGTLKAGRRLWNSVVDEYELDEHELALLVEAVRTVDLLTKLDAAVRRDGPIIDTSQGPRAHPAAVEARQQKIVLARLISALRMPDGEESERGKNAGRPQRRSGARGIYGIRGLVGS